jgi:hypothetical protein
MVSLVAGSEAGFQIPSHDYVMRTGDLRSGWLESDQLFLCLPWLEREGFPTE